MILWYTESLIGWMDFRIQGIEQAVEFALANETDVTNLNGRVLFSWARVPQGVAEIRMRDCKLSAKGVVVH